MPFAFASFSGLQRLSRYSSFPFYCCIARLLLLLCLNLPLTYSPAHEASNMKRTDLDIDRL